MDTSFIKREGSTQVDPDLDDNALLKNELDEF